MALSLHLLSTIVTLHSLPRYRHINSGQPEANSAGLTPSPKPTTTTNNVAHALHTSARVACRNTTLDPSPAPGFLPQLFGTQDAVWHSTAPHTISADYATRNSHSSAAHILPRLAAVLATSIHTTAHTHTISSPAVSSAQRLGSRKPKPMDAFHHVQ